MATVALSTTPVTLDPGTAYELLVVNSGSSSAHVQINGGLLYDERVKPGQVVRVPTGGNAVTAFVRSGSGQVDVTISAATNPQGAPAHESGQLDAATARGTYVQPQSNRLAILGNSRMARDLVTSGSAAGASIMGIVGSAIARAGGRASIVAYAGVSGDTLAQMLARFDTQVAPYNPDWIVVADGVNDATQNRTAAQMTADLASIVTKAKLIGARVLALTAPANTAHTTGQRQALTDYNRFLKQSTDRWVVPVDVATPVTDPTTGLIVAAYADGDGLHQSPAGAWRQGRVLASALTNVMPPRDPFGAGPVDTTNAVLNSWMGGSPGAGLPTSWASSGTGTFTTVARTDLIPGNWAQIDTSGAAADCFVQQGTVSLASGPLAVGDVVRLYVEMTADAFTSCTALEMSVQFRDVGSSTLLTLSALTRDNAGAFPLADQPLAPDVWVWQSPPVAIPALTTQWKILDHFNGQGKVRFGRHRLAKVGA